MIFDPLYLIILGIGFVLSFGAQLLVKSRVKRWKQVMIGRGLTGRDIALQILRAEGIQDVSVEVVGGVLTDHYDPRSKTLRLSPDIYHGRSIASAGIAAHEVGHAIQHKYGYAPMKLRQAMVPVANIGTNLGIMLVIAGMLIGITGLAMVGVLLFAGFVVFTLVTLPVEFDASIRARKTLLQHNIVSGQEITGVNQILIAAAATYVAAAATAILQLLYWAYRAGLIGGRR